MSEELRDAIDVVGNDTKEEVNTLKNSYLADAGRHVESGKYALAQLDNAFVKAESPFVHICEPLKEESDVELNDFSTADNIFTTLLRQNPDEEDKEELENVKKGMPPRREKSEATILRHKITGLVVSESDVELP
jgi:hypothetical protein